MKKKRLFVTMCMMGGFALLMSSCKKANESVEVSINLPQCEEEADGRAYIDFANGGAFKWNAEDQVAIYNLDAQNGANSERAIYQTTASAAGQATARFSFASGDQLSAKKSGYFVFYPVSKLDGELGEDNYQNFSVSATQQYSKDLNANPTIDLESMAMACTLGSLNGTFTLKHIFGILRLKLKGEGNVTRIVVEDSRFNLNGTVGMKLHAVDMDRFTSLQNMYINDDDPYANDNFVAAWNDYKEELSYSVAGGNEGKTITLECPSIGLNGDTETPFYVGLRPGALKYGFKVYVYIEGENEPHVLDYTGQNNLHYGIKAGVIQNISATL